MKTWIAAGTGLALLMAGGVALAQAPNPPPAPPAAADGTTTPPPAPGGEHQERGEHRERGERGEHGDRHGMGRFAEMMRMHMRPPAPSKAAHFRFRKGDATVDIKCADDEPTKACVDAGMMLLDKLAAQK